MDSGRTKRPFNGASGISGSKSSPTPGRESKAAILELSKYIDQRLRIKFSGGREVTGVLRGYDQLLNLVMDAVEEDTQGVEATAHRSLGLVVLRGTALIVINPVDGFEEIANPFAQT